jgi:hypothetical protein
LDVNKRFPKSSERSKQRIREFGAPLTAKFLLNTTAAPHIACEHRGQVRRRSDAETLRFTRTER